MKNMDLTIEEGQVLLVSSANFGLPEKLGDEQAYSIADRSIAGDEVRKLYRELRSWSPLLQKKERWQRFGPADLWIETPLPQGKTGHKCTDTKKIVSIRIDEEIISGIIWCLLVSLHPASPAVATIADQEDIFWPIAAKIRRTKIIREYIGMTGTKAQPKRWKSDDEYTEETSSTKPDTESSKG